VTNSEGRRSPPTRLACIFTTSSRAPKSVWVFGWPQGCPARRAERNLPPGRARNERAPGVHHPKRDSPQRGGRTSRATSGAHPFRAGHGNDSHASRSAARAYYLPTGAGCVLLSQKNPSQADSQPVPVTCHSPGSRLPFFGLGSGRTFFLSDFSALTARFIASWNSTSCFAGDGLGMTTIRRRDPARSPAPCGW